jgi:isopentenyl-diphosphate Delta-isomerase
MEQVILVDLDDTEMGVMEKIEAHQKGLLHRAFSVLIYNSKGEMLIQKRAKIKYHSGGLWTNACCSHPVPNEPIAITVKRRLNVEMGIDLELAYSHKFIYKTNLENELVEHEVDHVFVGQFDGLPKINKNEVEDWRYCTLVELQREINERPQNFTYWFKLIVDQQLQSQANLLAI